MCYILYIYIYVRNPDESAAVWLWRAFRPHGPRSSALSARHGRRGSLCNHKRLSNHAIRTRESSKY